MRSGQSNTHVECLPRLLNNRLSGAAIAYNILAHSSPLDADGCMVLDGGRVKEYYAAV